MIDWHSHVLPEMDDGSSDVTESLSMLCALKDQGVKYVIATPHFLADEESVDSFLKRRQRSYDSLYEKLNESLPSVICGAEIKYYPGISRMEDLAKLSIENTKMILLEMPMVRWTEYTLKEIIEISGMRGLTVIMAHIERYLAFQDNKTLGKLLDNGILMQANASFFNGVTTRRKALKLLDSGMLHFVGSDCHNMTTRPPRIGEAYDLIRRKFSEYYTSQMSEYGYRMLNSK